MILQLPAICKVSLVQLICVFCKKCGSAFCVCRCCWRGQVYCTDECRRVSYLESHRISQQNYRKTPKGILAHKQAENRRRQRKKLALLKKLDDASTTPPPQRNMVLWTERNSHAFQPGVPACCHFCGRTGVIMSEFPRRGYG